MHHASRGHDDGAPATMGMGLSEVPGGWPVDPAAVPVCSASSWSTCSTLEGPLYLAALIDGCSRACVGWAMAEHMRTELVTDALQMAVARRRPGVGLVQHSDQGAQYTAVAYSQRCRELGIRQSMGSVGDCFDNAMMEWFFATLECEGLADQPFATRAAARTAVFGFIEDWYNRRRRHSALGYLAPLEYEQQFYSVIHDPGGPPLTHENVAGPS